MKFPHGTLVVTIHCAEGFVVCADSKLAGTASAQNTQKLIKLGPRTCCGLLGANVFRGNVSLADVIREKAKAMGSLGFEGGARAVCGVIYNVFRELEQANAGQDIYVQFGPDVGNMVMAVVFVGMVGQKRYYGEARFRHNSGVIQWCDFSYERLTSPEQKIQGPRATIRELLDGNDERLASYRRIETVRKVVEFPERKQNGRLLPALTLAEAKELGQTYLDVTFKFADVFEPSANTVVGPPVQCAVLPRHGEVSIESPQA